MNDLLSSPVANALTWTLAHFLWQGLLVAVTYWAWQEAAGIRSARTRYATALAALIVIAACPLVTFMAAYSLRSTVRESSQTALALETGFGFAPTGAVTPLQNGLKNGTAALAIIPSSGTAAVANTALPAVESIFRVCEPYVLLLWMAGVMLSGARLMAGLANIVWLRWGRMEIAAELRERSQQIARRLGLDAARIFSSEHIREAAVVGFWRPVVLLPASWLTALPPDVLEAVIAHELAHIQRYDVWINLLQRVVETLLFYHPAVWWLSNRIRFEREMCCDELAVEATGDRGNYVIALEQVGRLQVRGSLHLATSFRGERKMRLLSRVKNVLQTTGKQAREPAWLVGVLAVVLPLLVLGIVGLRATQNAAVAQERDGARSVEAEAGPRGAAEKEGPRRSAEADAGPRRSAEGEAGARRSAEGERGAGRSAAGEGRGQGGDALRDFKPQTQREAALFQMIVQLQREVAALSREVQSRSGARPAPASRGDDTPRRDGDQARSGGEQFVLPARWQNTKEGRVFKAYDKNGDEIVSLDEWLAMTNGNISPARKEVQTKRFNEAEPSGDGKFTPAEFIYWYSIGQHKAVEQSRRDGARDGNGIQRGPRDGEGESRGPRTGGGEKPGPRDGEREQRGPRDGEGPEKRGPRDGESGKDGPRDGDRPRDGE